MSLASVTSRQTRYQLGEMVNRWDVVSAYEAVAPNGAEVRVVINEPTADLGEIQAWRVAARRLIGHHHPSLVSVFDMGETEHSGFAVSAPAEGQLLSEIWDECCRQRVAFPLEVGAWIARGLCSWMDFAGEALGPRGQLAVPPSCVLLTGEGEVKVDQAVAVARRNIHRSLADPYFARYRSPEEIAGRGCDARSSVYAVGIILWQLLTGDFLFPTWWSRGNPRRRPLWGAIAPSWWCRRVPFELDGICVRALKSRPLRRYQTCKELAADLDGFLDSRGWRDGQGRVAKFVGDLFAHAPGR